MKTKTKTKTKNKKLSAKDRLTSIGLLVKRINEGLEYAQDGFLTVVTNMDRMDISIHVFFSAKKVLIIEKTKDLEVVYGALAMTQAIVSSQKESIQLRTQTV